MRRNHRWQRALTQKISPFGDGIMMKFYSTFSLNDGSGNSGRQQAGELNASCGSNFSMLSVFYLHPMNGIVQVGAWNSLVCLRSGAPDVGRSPPGRSQAVPRPKWLCVLPAYISNWCRARRSVKQSTMHNLLAQHEARCPWEESLYWTVTSLESTHTRTNMLVKVAPV